MPTIQSGNRLFRTRSFNAYRVSRLTRNKKTTAIKDVNITTTMREKIENTHDTDTRYLVEPLSGGSDRAAIATCIALSTTLRTAKMKSIGP
jgi:hypothetical protein